MVVELQELGSNGVRPGGLPDVGADPCKERVCEQNIAKMGLKVAGEGGGARNGLARLWLRVGIVVGTRAHGPSLGQKGFPSKGWMSQGWAVENYGRSVIAIGDWGLPT